MLKQRVVQVIRMGYALGGRATAEQRRPPELPPRPAPAPVPPAPAPVPPAPAAAERTPADPAPALAAGTAAALRSTELTSHIRPDPAEAEAEAAEEEERHPGSPVMACWHRN